MSRAHKEACGCRTNDREYVEMCPPHKAEFDEIHHRWQAEHVERD
jgi:hypothetical protein